MPMLPQLPRLPHVQSFGRRRTPNAGSTMDSRRVAAPSRMTANFGQRPMTDVRNNMGGRGNDGGQRPFTDVRYGAGQQGGRGGNQHPWQQGGGGGGGNNRHPWQNGGGGNNNGGGQPNPNPGPQPNPGGPTPQQLPIDPYFEAQRRQLEDALAAQLAGLNPAREQIGANQTLQGARLGTNEGVQHQSLLESLAGRGAFGGGIQQRDEGDLATDYLRQRQDLANQGAAGYADLASQEGEFRNQYSSGLQEALLALANRSATDEYTPTPHVRDTRKKKKSGKRNDGKGGKGGKGRGGRRR